MPELPEVETVRRGLNQLTLNQKITGGDVLLDRTIAYPFSVGEFIDGIKNNAIAIWHRRGKYLVAELTPVEKDTGTRGHGDTENSFPASLRLPLSASPPIAWLGVHLRMTGQLLWVDRDEPLHKHTRVRLFFGDRQELRFVDQRTFGQMWWVPPGVPVESVITGLAKLAADPFADEFTVEYLAGKLQKRRRPIKTALLDQSVVAGLGNIYADEALFKSRILPETLCTDLQLKQIENLRTAIIQVLETSIEAGGTTFSNFLNVKGVNGNYGGVAWVYNRAGELCRICDTPIMRIKLAGRSSHFCPQCQRG
ncbi:formamidopyrimidine-DNA glycosylase [Nostoc linckia z18]|jgi:formamidopyrimidine-DNA glycosylase|uniref:Formamidopyrimidine-DNA glycosylase n=2 Tax=Nostoc linckia TaxID=92942 RepID=A0A9Q5ZH21_NOSLI|nr:DNA-formamidopyrimidine glycosylase [Nostoc linckia]PHK28418.1 formamidopyrimidine-DNA glycosylase [Nostoc linckia z15]PHK46115.1 formamidopyrimidine-DNA glycosylase [Nostoc linckia z16]PHJ68315.1 formamidopyrimidine-DNA glycosylase [Nostoc linckia z1]PHJ73751.1 formamidopyrimidine-DNA glycosylase [Nostoc linckia z3]PHJ78320.1 formamidopyrimidine-DNA glycosylase [Nostoc linckia z2]